MIAKQLESILADKAAKTDFSHRSPSDLVQRFQSLRGFGLLPKGRGKNAQQLSSSEVVAGILSLVTETPGKAGIASKVLKGLRPVGGVEASFEKCATFGEALARILEDRESVASLVEVRVSGSEIAINSHGRAAITYVSEGLPKTTYFVGQTALSLFQRGAEETFNPLSQHSPIINETIFSQRFFYRVSRAFHMPPPISQLQDQSDLDEDEEELKKEQRAQKLGIRPSSNFLNIGVNCHVAWPKEETVVEFEGYKIVLMPRTKDRT
ncbi:MAG: hypothetical protein MI741_12855, partial [Rhodospirillales bacterium]|nr:hypothetical protein [Rhodospirillales bacterium]